MYRLLCLLYLVLLNTHASAHLLAEYKFDIPAQSAQSALIKLALQRDLDIVFFAELTEKSITQDLVGNYTLAEAFKVMLKNTGLRANISNSRVVQIEQIKRPVHSVVQKVVPDASAKQTDIKNPPNSIKPEKEVKETIEVVEVVAQMLSPYNLGTTVASTKTQRDFLETPQSINALPKQLIDDRGARTLSEASLSVSAATYLEKSAGVTDEVRVRGFAYPSLKINGIGAHAYIAPTDNAFIESVEIAKGPNSVLFGRMEPGGIINMMLKAPTDQQEKLAIHYGSDDYIRAEFDASSSIGNDSSIRAIAFINEYGNEAELDQDDSKGLMIGFEHFSKSDTKITGHYRYESKEVLQQFGSPIEGFDDSIEFFRDDDGSFDVVIPRQSDLRSGLDVTRQSVYFAVNDWIMGDWSADLHLQYDKYKAYSVLDYPVIDNFVVDFNDRQVTEDQLTQALIQNPDFVRLLIEGIQTISVDSDNIAFEQEQFDYKTEFFSTEFTLYNNQFFSNYEFEQLYGVNFNYSEPETLIWQTHDTRSSFLPLNTSEVFFNTEDVSSRVLDLNAGLFAQWVFNWNRWTLFLGARADYLDFQVSGELVTSNRSFTETSIRAGGVYKLTEQTSFYLNYSEAFSPQFDLFEFEEDIEDDEEPLLTTITFPNPARSSQYEAGIKSIFLDGKLQAGCAIYQIRKIGIESLIQEQRSRGLECDLSGSFGSGWHITLGLNALNSEIIASDEQEFLFNKTRMSPEKSGQFWLSKDFAISNHWDTRWGIGVSYIDERYLGIENINVLDAYSVMNIAINLSKTKDFRISLLLLNALDEVYTEGVFDALPFWTNPGRERTFETRIEYRF